MRVDLFDFELPETSIALRPVNPRDAARLLVVKPGAALDDRHVSDLPDLLRPGDVLVVNDTKVIPAELRGERIRGEHVTPVSVTLYERRGPARWRAFARPARRLSPGDRLRFGTVSDNACLAAGLDATVEEKGEGGDVLIRFDLSGPVLDEAVHAIGHMPLPPYIAGKRAEDASDRADYQTIYAREEGAVAAPTAGLHFTDGLFERLSAAGIGLQRVTLHVGPGTFLPVKAEDTADHRMHAEWGTVSADVADALNRARANGGRIVAVGTTSLRLLESAATEDGQVAPFADETSIFITPGYRFKAVDILMTNFHLPRSTLFMLVSAFSGRETMVAAYRHAIDSGYRFYSYGDASLLFPETRP
ncbi:MAG: tRNA preQ1(34) S-adenosylmethionine ribosyltransferase-isomerase QueA [Bauldia litoralis]|uniref:tRNA preQ1(34) S-adenosylmethionine ribosyltransferase-isomerase QueA n=1 Tax=Bauldia litoralis TaxID=665467 RepID=UPI00329843B1